MEKIKDFFAKNGRIIVNIIVVHIAISIFGLMIWLPFDKIGENMTHTVLAAICGIFSMVFYFFMIYDKVWETGANDGIRASGGKSEATPARGFLIGLVAAVPDFIICILYVIFWFFQGYEWGVVPCSIFTFAATLWEGMFMGVKSVFFSEGPYMFIFVPFFTVLSAGISYILGTKDTRLLPIADNPEDAERRREAKANKNKLKYLKKQNKHASEDDEDELI